MNDAGQVAVKRWLRENRGGTTQEDLARDISERTGWRITRDRYSRYERGLTIGRDVLGHFVDYWQSKGVTGPDMEPVTVAPPDDLAGAIRALTAELNAARTAREEYEVRLRGVEAELRLLREQREDAESRERSVPRETTGSGR